MSIRAVPVGWNRVDWQCALCQRTFVHGKFLAKHLTEIHNQPTIADGPGGEYRPMKGNVDASR